MWLSLWVMLLGAVILGYGLSQPEGMLTPGPVAKAGLEPYNK